jgi:hypothetical protein
MYTIMSAMQPLQDIQQPSGPIVTPTGEEERTYLPDNTRQKVGVLAEIVLQPGESLQIRCPHGVNGRISVRGMNADGSLRRKSPTRKA